MFQSTRLRTTPTDCCTAKQTRSPPSPSCRTPSVNTLSLCSHLYIVTLAIKYNDRYFSKLFVRTCFSFLFRITIKPIYGQYLTCLRHRGLKYLCIIATEHVHRWRGAVPVFSVHTRQTDKKKTRHVLSTW